MPAIETLSWAGKSGWGWNVHLARLPSGGLFVYSPSWLGDDTFAQIEKHGRPEVLFCPNNVHHVTLERFRERWPQAMACASKGALPRLLKHGHAGLRDAAEAPLPQGAKLLVSEGTKNGETFLSLAGEWIVCDAFVNFTSPITGLTGLILKQMRIAGGLGIGSLVLWFAVADQARYREWLLGQLEAEKPRAMHFSHGSVYDAPDLPERIRAIAAERLG